MSDIRESFPTLEDGSAVGAALRAVQAGDATAAKNGSLGFAFKDSSGNAVLPSLDASGNIKTAFAPTNADGKSVRGLIPGNAALTTVASLALVASKIYDNLDFIVSCFRDAAFQVILSDNAVETILADAACGPGQPSFHGRLSELEISTGAVGVQLLLIKGINLATVSDLKACLSVRLTN